MAGVTEKFVDIVKLALDYGVDLSKRRVFLHGDLEGADTPGESHIEKVTKALLLLDSTEGPIELWINSPGGYMVEMFGLYDIITTRQNKIVTIGFGEIASAAGLILACGDERKVTENAFFMAHESASEVMGPKSLVDAKMVQWERENNQWAILMSRHTKHTKAWWIKSWKEKKEMWLNSKEMLRHGLVDSVIPRSTQR
jgi:ATP-dependent Clp protease protease subunit